MEERSKYEQAAVCLFGDYDPDYPRNAVIKHGLEKNGVIVQEINVQLKFGPYRNRNYPRILYLLNAYWRLIRGFFRIKKNKNIQYLIVPHNNHLIMPLARMLGSIYKVKVIMDGFDPAYRTALMKGLSPLSARMRYYLEKCAMCLADAVLVATEHTKEIFIEDYGLKFERKIFVVPDGADEQRFFLRTHIPKESNFFLVLYWGNFHPHHGIETILQAANFLKDEAKIRFVLVGNGSNAEKYKVLAEGMDLRNVEFLGYLPDEHLFQLIARAHVTLGIFSKHPLALCTITNKVFQGLAMGKAVITEDSPAVRAWFRHGEHLYTVPPEDGKALAQAILTLKDNPNLRATLERKGNEHFRKFFSEKSIGERLLQILEKMRC